MARRKLTNPYSRKDPPDEDKKKTNPGREYNKKYSGSVRIDSPRSSNRTKGGITPGNSGRIPGSDLTGREKAFAEARKKGLKEFTYEGKKFNTKMKKTDPDINTRSSSRTISYAQRKGIPINNSNPSSSFSVKNRDDDYSTTRPPSKESNSSKKFSKKKLKVRPNTRNKKYRQRTRKRICPKF